MRQNRSSQVVAKRAWLKKNFNVYCLLYSLYLIGKMKEMSLHFLFFWSSLLPVLCILQPSLLNPLQFCTQDTNLIGRCTLLNNASIWSRRLRNWRILKCDSCSFVPENLSTWISREHYFRLVLNFADFMTGNCTECPVWGTNFHYPVLQKRVLILLVVESV